MKNEKKTYKAVADDPEMVPDEIEHIKPEPAYQLCVTYDPKEGNVIRKRYLKPHELKER